MQEKRYLVYKSWNGQIHTSIEYGDLTTGEGKKKRDNEIKRFKLNDFDSNDLSLLKELYPLEENIK
jgi:hypothetical protein